jgi:glycine/sarcosine N-methyltransferase
MYDSFSSDYDRFVNWPGRLAFEMPFLERQLNILQDSSAGLVPGAARVLDAATGTGMHVLELRRRGYLADGSDLSHGMVERARFNAVQAGLEARFEVAGFGQLAEAFKDAVPYDALLCLGNSLPHLLTIDQIEAGLADFAACLRPGGLLIIQNRNFDAVLENKERWMEPQSYNEGEKEWIFLRFYDYEPSGLINFNIVTLQRQAGNTWSQAVSSTRLYALQSSEMLAALGNAGFSEVNLYGGMNGSPYDSKTSGNLVITARK